MQFSNRTLLSWYGYQEYTTIVAHATVQAENRARMLAEHAVRAIGEVEALLDELDENIEQRAETGSIDEKVIYPLLVSSLKNLPQISSFFMVSETGTVMASTLNYPIKRVNVADREYFAYHLNNTLSGTFISKPYKNRITGAMIFSVSRRLSKKDGSFAGIVAATINVSYFQTFYAEAFKNSYSHITLYRDDGFRVVAVPEESKELTEAELSEQSRRFNSFRFPGKVGTIRSRSLENGQDESLVGYAKLPGEFKLTAVVENHWDDVLSPWRKWTVEHIFLTLLLMAPLFVLYRRLVDRLKNEQAESEQFALLSRIVEQTPVSIVITDKNGMIEYVNDGFCTLTGYSRDEALGKNPRVLKSDVTPPETFINMWQSLSSGFEWRGELCNKKKDGTLYWEMAYIFPVLSSDGELTHYAAIKENITARKEAEDELKRARMAAEDANRSKSLFLATMSHEIRTPMNAILGMSYLALQSGVDDRQRGYLEKVTVAAKSLLTIINDILDFSKIEAGKMDIESIPLRLDALLESVESILRVSADEKGLIFKTSVASDIPLDLIGDPTRLQQILLNIGGNAVKFTEHGMVSISLRKSSRTVDEGFVAVRFDVKDSGIGMNEEQLEKIFAPFIQADSSITRRYGGTGLGLAIVKKMLSLMGGELEVISHPGEGSIFSFTLVMPCYCPVLGDDKQIAHDAGDYDILAGARILLMEDNQINRIIVQEMVSRFKINVTAVNNGKQGVDLIMGGETFDLVITDIEMPEMDGCEATSCIRSRFDKETLPIIAMTGYVLHDEVQQLLSSGINDHIAKPIDPDELTRILMKWIKPRYREELSIAPVSGIKNQVYIPKNLPGFNLNGAIKRLGNDVSLLMSVISDATPQLIKSVEQIREKLHEMPPQKETLLFELHGLAGSSANIGAERISKAIRKLESFLKDRKAVEILNFELVEEFESAIMLTVFRTGS